MASAGGLDFLLARRLAPFTMSSLVVRSQIIRGEKKDREINFEFLGFPKYQRWKYHMHIQTHGLSKQARKPQSYASTKLCVQKMHILASKWWTILTLSSPKDIIVDDLLWSSPRISRMARVQPPQFYLFCCIFLLQLDLNSKIWGILDTAIKVLEFFCLFVHDKSHLSIVATVE